MQLAETWRDRLGRVEVPWDFLAQEPDMARRILSELIVLRAEMMAATMAVEYDAACLSFDVVAEGERIPRYDVEYDPLTDVVTWERKDWQWP